MGYLLMCFSVLGGLSIYLQASYRATSGIGLVYADSLGYYLGILFSASSYVGMYLPLGLCMILLVFGS